MRIYIDIETIPSGDKIDPNTMPHPTKMSVEKTIEAWRKEKAPQEAEEQYRKRALKSMEGEIICIGYAFENDEVKTIVRQGETEEHIFLFFDALFKPVKAPEWVGHNILTFDMQWIWRKAVKYGCRWLVNHIQLNRYKGNIHDTMRIWGGADYQDYTSLDNLAKWLGVGEQVGSGSETYELYLAGKTDEIAEHCKTDVELVRRVYQRITGEA